MRLDFLLPDFSFFPDVLSEFTDFLMLLSRSYTVCLNSSPTSSHDFLYFVLKILGPRLVKELSYLYGNENSFYFNITEYFNTRFEDDEIRKATVEDIMNSEIETDEEKSETSSPTNLNI